MSFKRYTIDDVNVNRFYQLPKFLFRDDLNLNNDARILYALLRDRHELSMRNKWVNSKGEVYLIYPRDDMAKMLGVTQPTIRKIIDRLKKANLMCEERQGCNKPNLIYLNYISDIPTKPTDPKQSNKNLNCVETKKGSESRMNTGLDNFFTPKNEEPKGDKKIFHSEVKNKFIQDCKNSSLNKTNSNKTEFNQSNLILKPLFLQAENENSKAENDKIDKTEEYKNTKENVKEQISYEALIEQYPSDLIDQTVNIITDVLTSSAPTIRVSKEDKPSKIVKSQFQRLEAEHIQNFMFNVSHYEIKNIKNIKNYIISSLYNSVNTFAFTNTPIEYYA